MIFSFASKNNFVLKFILSDISIPKECCEEVKTTEFDDVFDFGNDIKHISMISRFRAWLTG